MTPFCFYRIKLVSHLRAAGETEEAAIHLDAMAQCAQTSDCLCAEVCLAHVQHLRAHERVQLPGPAPRG